MVWKRRTVIQACEFKAYEFLSKDYMTFDTGGFHTNEELAAILRDYTGSIQVVVDACNLHR